MMKKRQRLRVFRLAGLALAGWLVGMFVVPAFFSLPEGLTDPDAFAPGVTYTDREGVPLRRLLADEDLRIDAPASLNEIPASLINATLAAEDSRFFQHGGIDFLGLARAVRDAVWHREFVSGASTVTQQLVKISSPPRPRSFRTKVIEMFTARKLEMSWDKEEILEAYLNRLPYGNQLTGCRAAARAYFGKPLGDLSLAESAFLAGLPNKPTRFNPYRNFEGAQDRQHWILGRMLEEQWITESDLNAARGETLRLTESGAVGEFEAPHFVELVQLAEEESGEVHAETTIDLKRQHFVEQTIQTQLQALDQQIGGRLATQSAVVVIDNASGDVLALAGSRNFFESEGGQINGAWTPRSPGSTLKPFTYLLALERGYTAATVLPDVPVEYVTKTGAYRPVNYDRRFRGPVTVRHALANSLNVPAIRMLDAIGGPENLHRVLTGPLGLTGFDPDPQTYGLGLTLGNAEVRLLELTNAYACIARLGIAKPFRLTRDASTQQGQVADLTLFDRESCWIIADILSDNLARAEAFGLDSPLRLPFRVAAKTGTSTDYRDNWTVGFTPEYTVGVWVGHFGNTSLQNVSGVSGAGPIFHAVMAELHAHRKPIWYPRPDSLIDAEIDPLNGKRVLPGVLSQKPTPTIREVFRPGTLPEPARPEDYEDDGRVKLPPVYATWLAEEGKSFAKRAVPDTSHSAKPRLRIVSPISGTVAYLDSDLPGGGKRFPLRFEIENSPAIPKPGESSIRWTSDTLRIESDEKTGRAWLILEPGSHEVVATDSTTGVRSISRIAVETL
ncbi:MAG: penicillin-binding protein 1C [Verrucomicrobiae bacterium]|nr:penicillin-binding protein 1C [Verrucomicrobiae bacterium]